jgi:hypothetical protein
VKIDDYLKLSQTSVEEILNKEQRSANSTQLEEEHAPIASEERDILKDDGAEHEKPRNKRKRTEMDRKNAEVAGEKGTEKDFGGNSSRFEDVVAMVNKNPTPDGIMRLLQLSTVPYSIYNTYIQYIHAYIHTYIHTYTIDYPCLSIPKTKLCALLHPTSAS